MCNARFSVATLKYGFPKVERPSDIAESSKENIHNAATFWKWFSVMDNLTNFYKYFWIFMDKFRNCTSDKFLKRLWKTSLFEFFYYRSIYLSICWATIFSWFSICFVKIFKKPIASCFIFSGLHKPIKHHVYYSWIIRLTSLSVLGINDKIRNISNSRCGNHDNIVSWS